MEIGPDTILRFLLIVYSIILHEIAHGAAALWYGDETAKHSDRLTLNPIPHVDPIGTVIFPAIQILSAGHVYIGWAKPVPVNPYNLHPRVRGEVVVAIAGVTVNFLLAVLFAVAVGLLIDPKLPFHRQNMLTVVLLEVMFANIALGIFNLLPIPPLDGSHVVEKLLPADLAAQYRQIGFYGIFIILALSYFGVLGRILGPPVFAIVSLLEKWVIEPVSRLVT